MPETITISALQDGGEAQALDIIPAVRDEAGLGSYENVRLTAESLVYLTLTYVPPIPVTSVAGKLGDVSLVLSDVEGLTDELAGRENRANRGVANGYATLDENARVPAAELGNSPVLSVAGKTGVVTLVQADIANLVSDLNARQLQSAKGQPNGYAGLDSLGRVPAAQLTPIVALDVTSALGFTPENAANRAVANGYASLDGNGSVPAAQLANSPVTSVAGRTGAITLALADVTNLVTTLAGKQDTSARGQANGYATLDAAGQVPLAQLGNAPVGGGPGEEGEGLTSGQIIAALGFLPEDTAHRGQASGYASLNASGTVPSAQLPAVTSADVIDALGFPPLQTAPVRSVFGREGAVIAANNDYSVGMITGAAPLNSPALTGLPTAPTAGQGINNTQIATTAYVRTAVDAMSDYPVESVFGRTGPIFAEEGDYAVAQIIGAAPLASPALSGTPTAPTAGQAVNNTQIATTAYVRAAINALDLGGGGGAGAITSVFGRTGQIIGATGDYTVGQVTGAAPLASPGLTGTPTAPTAGQAINTTQIATTAYVRTAINALDIPETASLARLDSPTFTGTPTAPTVAQTLNNTQIATTAWVRTWTGNKWSTITRSLTGADNNLLTITNPGAGLYVLYFCATATSSSAGNPVIGWNATWQDTFGNTQNPANLNTMRSGATGTQQTQTLSASVHIYGVAVIDVSAGNIVVRVTGSGVSGTSFRASVWVQRLP